MRASGVDFTLIRAAWFAQNFSEGYLRDPILAGVLPMPGGDVKEPIVDIDDIAEIAVAALTEDRHSGALYEVTGPELLSFAEMAEILSAATGRTIRHQPISFEEFHAGVAQAGDTFVADVFTAIARETLDGRNAHLTDGVERALCRPPRSFAALCPGGRGGRCLGRGRLNRPGGGTGVGIAREPLPPGRPRPALRCEEGPCRAAIWKPLFRVRVGSGKGFAKPRERPVRRILNPALYRHMRY